MAAIWKGTPVAAALQEKYRKEADELRSKGIEPTLLILRIGDREGDKAYERAIYRRGEALGVKVTTKILPVEITETELVELIHGVNADDAIHGVIMMRPLPDGIRESAVSAALAPGKDVDGMTPGSLVGVFTGTHDGFSPCTSQACVEMLDYYGVDCRGKKAVVLGRSMTVGRPAAMLLLERNATVTICHSKSADLEQLCRDADILVVGIGVPNRVNGDCLRPGQYVVDAGISVLEDGTLIGDVDYEAASGIVEAVTPVDDGVGAITSTLLMGHVVEAARRGAKKE